MSHRDLVPGKQRLKVQTCVEPVVHQRHLRAEILRLPGRIENAAAGLDGELLSVQGQGHRCEKMEKGIFRIAFGPYQLKALCFRPVVPDTGKDHNASPQPL